ncbi:PREDICTED: uncharacterized protein LOC108537994 [Rhinopithecus bieti]|uniref:uncharacterized protein LOC108537994 n=1 Tax=Rhinopithecus bieti TaxID=61621 RepID=UPI00083C2E9C|nr:PREDICTED: uncharacterized protein LOC108537994 [Rhinopithecus bieti]
MAAERPRLSCGGAASPRLALLPRDSLLCRPQLDAAAGDGPRGPHAASEGAAGGGGAEVMWEAGQQRFAVAHEEAARAGRRVPQDGAQTSPRRARRGAPRWSPSAREGPDMNVPRKTASAVRSKQGPRIRAPRGATSGPQAGERVRRVCVLPGHRRVPLASADSGRRFSLDGGGVQERPAQGRSGCRPHPRPPKRRAARRPPSWAGRPPSPRRV